MVVVLRIKALLPYPATNAGFVLWYKGLMVLIALALLMDDASMVMALLSIWSYQVSCALESPPISIDSCRLFCSVVSSVGYRTWPQFLHLPPDRVLKLRTCHEL